MGRITRFQLPSWDTGRGEREDPLTLQLSTPFLGYMNSLFGKWAQKNFQLPSWDTHTIAEGARKLGYLSTPFLGYFRINQGATGSGYLTFNSLLGIQNREPALSLVPELLSTPFLGYRR